ncbi:hypothetical protein QF026_005558 [Streptomyces aurantiacus]|uniref:hypothetical protein n=1 Tax=Streptomyces aurantiacus TaxID=47760 RepID=UPI0027923DFC|nr:hypothetical protein [Streptomyces aurantiacus]MDQ0777092.1 hypothetical protein [Streptomyces aurantiacus]
MSHRIGRFVEPLLKLLFPGSGRRRLPAVDAVSGRGRHRASTGTRGDTAHRVGSSPLRGEDHVMVRPYLVAHEQREEVRRRRARRRALRLAVYGVDIDPRLVHGVEATA